MVEYQVVIGRDKAAGVWFVRTTNVPGLALEDASLDNLLEKLPDAISWVVSAGEKDTRREIPYQYFVVDSERALVAV